MSPTAMSYEAAHRKRLGYPKHHPVTSLENVWVVTTDITDAVESYSPDAETPNVKNLIKSLIPILEYVEQQGITDFNWDWRTRGRLSRIIGEHGMCFVAPPGGPYPPGILMNGHAWGWERTKDPERDVVSPVQEWLDDSTLSGNLFESLRNKRNGDAVGVAALVADGAGPAFAMIRTLAENPGVPIRTPLVLPDEVDAVVLIAGNEVLDFGLDGKVWRRSER